MRIAKEWNDYKVLATGNGYKLEKWGEYKLLRPDPQVIWHSSKNMESGISAKFDRTDSKKGEWTKYVNMPDSWIIKWRSLRFSVQPMNFKHTGVFPEQACNWALLQDWIKAADRPIKVLNLFAYTGGATLAAAAAGASVVHVDAAKAMVYRAKDNAALSSLSSAHIRYIVDDCEKFVDKELRRGNKYDIIIMDPPSFGRGPNGETWKLEDKIHDLVKTTSALLSDNAIAMVINSYTTGLQPTVMANILSICCPDADVSADEIGLQTEQRGVILPAGCTAIARMKEKICNTNQI